MRRYHRASSYVLMLAIVAPLCLLSTPAVAASAPFSRPSTQLSAKAAAKPPVKKTIHANAPTKVPAKAGAPVVTMSPRNATVANGGSVTFFAAATGSPVPSVRWQVSLTKGRLWSYIPGAVTATYKISSASSIMSSDRYRAVFANTSGSATSTAAVLIVAGSSGEAPQMLVDPESAAAYSGTTVIFTAQAVGDPLPSVQWQESPASGALFVAVPGATGLIYSTVASSTINGSEYRAVFTNSAGQTVSSTATLSVLIPASTTTTTVPTSPNPTTTTTLPTTPSAPAPDTSNNWSGYAATSSTFSAVSATWTVVPAQCSAFDTYSATWIGIDGATSPTVEQDGTSTDCTAGTPSYTAWYEMYGDTSVTCNCYSEVPLSQAKYPVSAGDVMKGSVVYGAGEWTLSLSDVTSQWAFTTQIADPVPAPDRSSAEWIVERPTLCLNSACTFTALSNITPEGPVTFTNAAATSSSTTGSISAFTNVPIEMVSGSVAVDIPSQLSPDGSSFTVTQ
jgi:hypothetical protein